MAYKPLENFPPLVLLCQVSIRRMPGIFLLRFLLAQG